MAGKRSRGWQPDYAMFTVSVSTTSAYISRRIPNQKRGAPDDIASGRITIEGGLDTPVIRRQSALIYVHCREEDDPGGAIGVNDTHWQVLVYLPPARFSDLMALVATQRLARVDLLTDALRYGKGRVRSAGFHTAPVSAEAEE